jgi:hypothetical protein
MTNDRHKSFTLAALDPSVKIRSARFKAGHNSAKIKYPLVKHCVRNVQLTAVVYAKINTFNLKETKCKCIFEI